MQEFIADGKAEQQETLAANVASIKEELTAITSSLSQVRLRGIQPDWPAPARTYTLDTTCCSTSQLPSLGPAAVSM